MPLNSKKKGNLFELTISKLFSEALGIEFRRVPASGGMEEWRGDLTPVKDEERIKWRWIVECKNSKKLMIWEWLKKLEIECVETNKKPLLVFHYPRNKDYAIIRVEDLLNLLKER